MASFWTRDGRRWPAGRALLLAAVAAAALAASPPWLAVPGVAGAGPARAEREEGDTAVTRGPGDGEGAVPRAAKGSADARKRKAKPVSSRGDARFDAARRRYATAVGLELPELPPADKERSAGLDRVVGGSVLVLDKRSTKVLVERGWRGPGRKPADPVRQGERVRVYAGIAKALGMPASVGGFQANFGTPSENGLDRLAADLVAARQALASGSGAPDLAATVQERERTLEAAVGALPRGPKGGWALADLDVNDDGRVNRADLKAARAAAAAPTDGNPAGATPVKRREARVGGAERGPKGE